jgi:DNA-3-methyladenine glycosylase I
MPESARSCDWPRGNPLMQAYHDTEWGVPLYDDRKLFEFLVLDAMQAGLSWQIVLNKREGFRKALDNFDPRRIAGYRAAKVKQLLADPGIIRNRLKVHATVTNARVFLALQREQGSVARFLWDLVGGRPVVNRWTALKDIPARTELSDRMSKELAARGFRFVGSTICYAFMQAAGMVNDHLVRCDRHRQVQRLARPFPSSRRMSVRLAA